MNRIILAGGFAAAIAAGYYGTEPPEQGLASGKATMAAQTAAPAFAPGEEIETRSVAAQAAEALQLPPGQEAQLAEALEKADAMAERLKRKLQEFRKRDDAEQASAAE